MEIRPVSLRNILLMAGFNKVSAELCAMSAL
jgi:hypothetical protein